MAAVSKAVIPAAGFGTRQYPATGCVRKPFFPLVDRDGRTKPILQIVIEEALAGGAQEVCLVGLPPMEGPCRRYFSGIPEELLSAFQGKQWALEESDRLVEMGRRLTFVPQPEPLGLGHAVWCARRWVGDEPFMVLLGDHVFVSTSQQSCAAQLAGAFDGHAVTALVPIGEEDLARFGVVRGRVCPDRPGMLLAEGFLEKPDPETARARCRLEGLSDGQYLAHFGMHVFTPGLLDVLDEMVRGDRPGGGEFELTRAQDVLCRREPYMGLVMQGAHYDIGTPAGILEAQMALAVSGRLRREALQMWRRAWSRLAPDGPEPA